VNYGVTFPLSEKIDVNGDDKHPLFADLEAAADVATVTPVTSGGTSRSSSCPRDGEVVGRFGPTVTPDDPSIVSAIESQLATTRSGFSAGNRSDVGSPERHDLRAIGLGLDRVVK
jgi:glutathione peroxidase-family protein